MSKTHAREYLLEMASGANTPGWMHDLIVRVVMSNGQLTEDALVATAEQLKTNAPAAFSSEVRYVTDDATEILLTDLIHHSGVNALASEQTISFSKDITLLYGYNGTGKSSYFRILNEMVGGNREVHVYQNIFSQVPAPINVELKYKEKVQGNPERWDERSISWNGEGRAFAPLTQASVFDSDYTNLLLEKRSADTAIVKPLGLHLFTALTTAMDNIRNRLETEKEGIVRSLPRIPQDNLGLTIVNILNSCDFSQEQKKYITDRYTMPTEIQQSLEECQKAYNELMAKDFDANIRLAQNERSLVDGLKKHMDSCFAQLTKAEQAVAAVYPKVKAVRTAQEVARQKIKILEEIGNTGSKEWQAFIQSGAAFQQSSTITAGTCPYCRQPLVGDAANIVKAYGDFLDNSASSAYKQALKEKSDWKEYLERFVTTYNVTEPLMRVLSAQENGEQLNAFVVNCFEQFEKTRKALVVSFETEQYEARSLAEEVRVDGSLGKIITAYDEKLKQLAIDKAGKEEQLKKLNETRLLLLQHKAIAEQHTLWEQWFAKVEQIRELERCQGKLSTRPVSTQSRVASQELLTESLRTKFEEELGALKLGYLKVSLEEDGASRGQSYMKIKLPAAIRTQEILSEGEQKGVALALFIAERRMEQVKNPIILDDPVNSLDHHITALLMERLVDLGNQVVIFSHHILLRDSLLALRTVHECNKLQINGCQKQNKHLFLYNVNARDAKGYIRDSRQDNARYYIQEAQRVLGNHNFDEATDINKCSGLLRQAIEHMVDEKVFRNLVPVKYRGGKSQTIIWDRLKELQADPALIDMMRGYYGRLSGGDMHLGGESRENPIDWAELNEMTAQLFAAL